MRLLCCHSLGPDEVDDDSRGLARLLLRGRKAETGMPNNNKKKYTPIQNNNNNNSTITIISHHIISGVSPRGV